MSFEDQDRQSDPGLAPGTIIAGRFQVESKLGEGGMGAVYRAINATTGRAIALKVMHPEFAIKKDVVRRFMREAKAATAIRHPNVIEVLDVVEGTDGEPVMVMELLDGEPLDTYMERTGPLALGEVARVMTPVVSAVGAAHSLGIIHRDLKPENIFLSRGSDGSVRAKVLDFGIAKVLDPNQINELVTKSGATRTGSMLGTPHYMSIEQACGEKDIDHRTDIWSMGIILYSMLSGRRPYEGENYGQILRALMTATPSPIQDLVPNLPENVVDIVNRCMARAREERPQDLRELFEVLSRYTEDRSVQAPASIAGSLMNRDDMVSGATLQAASVYVSQPGGGAVRVDKPRRNTVLVGVAVVFLMVGAGVGVALSLRGNDSAAVAEPAASSVAAVHSGEAPSSPAASERVVEIVGSTHVPPAEVSSLPPAAKTSRAGPHVRKPVPTAKTSAGGKPEEPTAEPTSPEPKSTGGGIIETLPY